MTMDHLDNAASLEAFLVRHVPLAAAAGVEVLSYDKASLIVSAPLEKNINDKGTAFGGSLYNLCVIAGWGITALKCNALNLEGDIVVAKGEIEYLQPLKSDLVAVALTPSDGNLAQFCAQYERKGRAALSIEVSVADPKDGSVCVRFTGKYAIVKTKESVQSP